LTFFFFSSGTRSKSDFVAKKSQLCLKLLIPPKLKYQRLSGKKDDVVQNYETLYEQNGWQGVLHAYLENIKAENGNGSAAYFIAMLSVLTGERDQAFQYLDLAVQRHLLDVAGLKGSPELDSLRNDPRFESLLVRTGMAKKS
jgi:hypothetical protein